MKLVKNNPVVPIESIVSEYDALRSKRGIIDKRMEELSALIKAYAAKNGAKSDSGSMLCENEEFVFGSQMRKTIKLDETKAIPYLKKRGFKSAILTVEVVDEEAVDRLIAQGKITPEQIEPLTTTKPQVSVYVQKKEEMTEVEQVKTPIAASVRGRSATNFGRPSR